MQLLWAANGNYVFRRGVNTNAAADMFRRTEQNLAVSHSQNEPCGIP